MLLTEEDRQFIGRLCADDILENVAPYRINGDGRNIVVMCADGHQAPDVVSTHARLVQRDEHSECCCHTLTVNGGALNLSPGLTRRIRLPIRQVLLSQIRQSMALKGANTVALYVHAPCGMARLRELSMTDVLDHLFAAKAALKQHFLKRKKFRVACFVQVDYGNKKRTYFISRKKWEAWKIDKAASEQVV